jgi:hypothetical protein
MPFQNQLFISYTHLDNQVSEGDTSGWITHLHKALAQSLEMQLGEPAKIWRDEKLTGNDNFSEEILTQFNNVALMVSVLSPRYLKSEWCQKEAIGFCRAAEATGGVEVNRKFRVIKVYQSPLEKLDPLPEAYTKALGYPFYGLIDNVTLRLDPTLGPDVRRSFLVKVADLAQRIAETLQVLAAGEQADRKGPTVFLSQTGWDLDSERKMLESELSNRGYVVSPQRDLSSREKDCQDDITRLLLGCKLTVHMIGKEPGMVPDGPSHKSVVMLQNELAAQQSKVRGMPRIVWIPPGTRSTDPEHQEFLVALTRNEEVMYGADVVTGDFEHLKTAVLGKLQKIKDEEDRASTPIAKNEGDLLYVNCTKDDAKVTVELRKSLRNRGFDPQRPLFEGDANAVRTNNDQLLTQCRATLVYYGEGDKDWYDSTITDVGKASRRVPVWTYVAGPVTSHKQDLVDEFGGQSVIDGLSGVIPEKELDRMRSALPGQSAAGGGAI